ncbi:MAG: 50S ribosomal protein L18Ae [Desulfurococcales archaeon]|jgi:large subunit ribosomal protein LX|nr:50S ribosomal protein L18Ae [Desulfurococcales archaeon]
MSEVKTYRVVGLALFGHDKFPEWRRFSLEVRALNENHALEYIYSVMGGRHKLKRSNIKILRIEEIKPEEARSSFIRELSRITGWEIVR